MRLIIGNKNYSSWSLRPWLLAHAFDLPFEERLVSLNHSPEQSLSERLSAFSDSARVPVLEDGDLSIWDSLAICEYLSDVYLDGRAWPQEQKKRAIARSLVAEMHSGFSALRAEMPMNIRASRRISPSEACLSDIQRVDQIFSKYAERDAQGDLRLLGDFSIADCFFAPVVMRFATYRPALSTAAQAYCENLTKLSSLQQWIAAAREETEIVPEDEAGEPR